MGKESASQESLQKTATLIIRIREALGLSQLEFANKIGAGQSSVSRWEMAEAPPAGKFFFDILNLALELNLVENPTIGKSVEIIGSIETGQYYSEGEMPDQEKFKTVIPSTKDNELDKSFGYQIDDIIYKEYPKGSQVICVKLRDLGRELSPFDHLVIAERHPERASMETLFIGIPDGKNVSHYDGKKLNWDKEKYRVAGVIKSSFSERNC